MPGGGTAEDGLIGSGTRESSLTGTTRDAAIRALASPIYRDGRRRDHLEEEGDRHPITLPILPQAGNNSLQFDRNTRTVVLLRVTKCSRKDGAFSEQILVTN